MASRPTQPESESLAELTRRLAQSLASTTLSLRDFAESLGRVERAVRTLTVSSPHPAVSAMRISAGPGTDEPALISLEIDTSLEVSLPDLAELGPHKISVPMTLTGAPQAFFLENVAEDERPVRVFAELTDEPASPRVTKLVLKVTG